MVQAVVIQPEREWGKSLESVARTLEARSRFELDIVSEHSPLLFEEEVLRILEELLDRGMAMCTEKTGARFYVLTVTGHHWLWRLNEKRKK